MKGVQTRAIESGSEWISTDRDARFVGLRFRLPFTLDLETGRLLLLVKPGPHHRRQRERDQGDHGADDDQP